MKDQLFAIHSRHGIVGDNQIDIPLSKARNPSRPFSAKVKIVENLFIGPFQVRRCGTIYILGFLAFDLLVRLQHLFLTGVGCMTEQEI